MKFFAKTTSIILVALYLITQVPFTTKAQTNDLTFTDLTVEVLDDARTKISWSTNYPAYFLLEYGLTSDYGANIRGVELKNRQQVTLQNLESKKKYHFRIIAYTDGDMRTVTFDQTFTASKEIDTEKPEVLDFRIPLTTQNTAYFQIQTDEKAVTVWI